MRRRFIVLINDSTTEQDDLFLDYIKKNNFGWWHWINNSWLLATYNDITAGELRNELNNFFKNEHLLVIELRGNTDDTWAGFGPTGKEKNMFSWLKETWNKKN